MEFQGWTFPTPDSMYTATKSTSPFNANVSSFFHRPSKIVKTHSRNASPRHNGRRRTTSNGPVSRTRSLLDRQRPNVQRQFAVQQQGRPLSWHPNSYSDFTYTNQGIPTDIPFNSYPQFMYGTTAVNGLVTPLSYPIPDEPQIQELITPLEELSAQEAGNHCDSTLYGYQYWVGPELGKEQIYAMDNMFPQQQVMPQTWQYHTQYTAPDIPTAPSSPSFLPIQGGLEASPLSLDTQKLPSNIEGEELVGMGLYDSPADVQSSSLLFGGGLNGAGRKRSLKLEESFEPAPESSDAEDEEESDGEDDNDDEDQEEPEDTQIPIYSNQVVQPGPSMAGQTFFFDTEADGNSAYATNTTFMRNDRYHVQYPGYSWT